MSATLPERVALATRNRGKLAEARAILRAAGVREVVSIADLEDQGLAVGDIEETGDTFEANALIKARAVSSVFGLPAIGDDSGLVVDALDGAPGVRSARFAADHDAGAAGDSEANMALLLQRLGGVPESERAARFVCVAALVYPGDDAPRPGGGPRHLRRRHHRPARRHRAASATTPSFSSPSSASPWPSSNPKRRT